MPANNYYALRARIASDEYMRNDRETQDSVRLSDIRMMSIRDFDTAPTVMSSEFIERGAQVRDSILGAYSKYGDAVNKDFTLRSTLDLAMSLVLNKPYESVAKNHDAYKRIFTGQDLDDKSLGTAMADAWNSDQIANDIATLQRRKDATDDPEEEAFLEKQIMAKEREAVRLGDYSSVRGWFGDQLVKTAMIAPQVMKGATQSVVYALAFAALSNLVSPAGAGMLLNGTSIAGGASLLGWLSSMSRSAQTAAQIGSAVGNTMYLAQDVFPREYGTMSRQLEQLVDDYGNKMDKETRKKAASVYAVASTLIEFMTPEPGLGKLMYGIAPKAMTSTSFMGWLKRVGVNMLQGGASESLEEAIQDFVGSFVQDVAKSKSNEKGTTNYELESFLDRLPGYVSQGFSTFMDTLVPSMIVGIPGAVTSSSLATYLTNVANEKDSIFRQASDDGRIAAMNTQKITSRAKIVPSIIIDTPTHSIAEFTSRIEETDEKGHLVTTEKLDPVKVRFDRARGRYVPIDDYNADLAKYIGVHIGNEAIAVEIENDGAVRITPDDIRNAAETSGGAVRDGSEIVFRTQNEAMQFASSLGESATLIRNDDGSIAIDYIDADGNEQIQGITIEENADIESLVQSEHARLGVNQPSQQSTPQSDNVQDTTEQTTVEDMAKAIHDASRGRITEKTANALARLFDIMPENVKNTIFTTNNGRLVITDKEYERITGRKLGNNSRAAAWLNRMQMIFTGKSDASSFVHEMGHLAILANPELEEGVRLAFAVNLDAQEGLDTFLRFIDENKDIIRVKSREEAINLLRELGDINRSGGFSENAEELLMSMLEAHFRADVRAENLTQLPQNIRDIFQKIANAIRRVYGRATGNTELPRDVQDAFNSFFWNGENTVTDTTASVNTAEPMTNSEVIRNQGSLGENAVERGQKKFMRMADDRFVRSIEKDIFLPEYVVKAKLGSENQSVVEIAKRELDDRDKFALLSPADSKAIFETDSADEYVSRMKESGTLSLADEADAERIYRKAWEYAHVMTPKEAVNTFKQRFGTLPGLIELKNILGPRRIQVTREGGGSYTRMYVPASNHIYQLLSKLNTNSPISEVNEVLSSMDSNPRAWLHAYQDAVNAGAKIKGSLSEDQDVLDSYIDMADADFDIIKNELRRGEEPYGVSYDTVYGVSSADITNLSVEEAERLSREAGNTEESDNTVLTRDEAEKLRDSLGIARRAADRAINTARETEEKMSALKQKHAKEESQMMDTIQVLRKTVNRRTAEVKDLRERIARLADKNNQQAHEYSQKLRKAESEKNKAEREKASAEKRLQDSRDSFNRRMEEMRKKVADARKEAHDQNIRANKLDRRLKALATKTMSERITRAIKGKLRINKKTHDMAMLEEPTYYIYYLMHNGQNRRFSEDLSTERMNGVDAQLDKLRAGASDGLFVMDEDGNINPQTIDLSHTDANGNLVTSYSGNLGTYMYDRSQIPSRLKNHLSKSTISKLESPGKVTWNSLTVSEKREIYDALVAVREEAVVSRSDVTDAIQTERRMLAREAARTVMEAPLGEITDEMREAVKKRLKSQDPDYDGTPTDEQVWDDIAKHPSQYMNAVEPGKTKEKLDAFRLSFLKMQRITRILDGGKEDGPFSRIFVRAFQNGYDKVLRNIDRRNSEFYSALENIIGKKNSKDYKARIEDLRKTKMHFKTRAISGSGVDMNLLQVMAMYIYSQNIHGATKLLSTEGNNFSLEDIARVNPKKVAEYINLELTMRADRGRDASHPSPFILDGNDEVLIKLRDRINNGEIVSEVPEWVRNIGDMMIDQLAKETPRLAQAAYKDYNTLLEIQDRYFPLVPASRGSWGDIFGNPNKGGMAHVNSGSLNIRQQSARYPLLLDPFSTFMSAIREQENLINMSKPVSDAAYLLKFGRVEELVRNRFGDKWAKAIHEYVGRIANPENHLTDVEKMFNRIYGNAAAAKIGLNLMTALKQFVSLVPAAFDGRLSVADVIRGFGHAIPHNKETAALMDELAYSTLRSGYNVEISRLQHMDDISRLGTASQRFVEVSTWLTNKSDQLTKMIIWSAMYDKQIRAGSSEADAAYAATDLVNRTMSVTSPISLSEMQSKQNPFTRLMFMFTNDLFQMWNILYSDIPMDFKNKEYGRAFMRFSGVVLSATILGFLAGGWLPDKDDEEKFQADDLLKDIVDNLLGYGFPLLGQEVTEWTRGYSQDIISAPGELYRVGSMIFKDLTSDKEYTADEYFDQIIDTLLAAGEMAGVPATGLKRPVQSVYDSDTGEWRLNLAYLFGTRWGDGAQNLLARTVN